MLWVCLGLACLRVGSRGVAAGPWGAAPVPVVRCADCAGMTGLGTRVTVFVALRGAGRVDTREVLRCGTRLSSKSMTRTRDQEPRLTRI